MVSIFLANGFETIEATAFIDVMERSGITVRTISVENTNCITSAHNITMEANSTLQKLTDEQILETSLLYLPGGPGFKTLNNNQRLLSLLKKANKKRILIAAICAAPIVLDSAEILDQVKITMYPGMENMIKSDVEFSNQDIVEDKNILTSKGPGTTIDFSLFIAAKFRDDLKIRTVKDGMLI